MIDSLEHLARTIFYLILMTFVGNSAAWAQPSSPPVTDSGPQPGVSDVAENESELAEQAKEKEEEESEEDGPEEVEEGEEDEEEQEPATIMVKVPHHLRGFTLHTSVDDYVLAGAKVEVDNSHKVELVRIRDFHGRIRASDHRIINEHMLGQFDPDDWRVGLHLGHATVHGNAFDQFLLNGSLGTATLDLHYSPTPLGVKVSVVSLSEFKAHEDFDVTAEYRGSQLRVGATFELVPFYHAGSGPSSGASLQKLHVLGMAGLFQATHSVTISDGVVSVEGEGSNFGALGGLEMRHPFYKAWLNAGYHSTIQKIEIEELGFESLSVQSQFSVGASYAF